MPFILPWILLALFGLTLWGNRKPAPGYGDTAEVPLNRSLQWSSHNDKGEDKADAAVTFTSTTTGQSLGISLFDDGGVLRIRNEDVDGWSIKGNRYVYFWDESVDIGAWVAARPDVAPGYDIGIRLSPVRTFYGVLAPDLLIGSRSVGVGISAYVPKGVVPRDWGRFGLGAGYLADYGGLGSGFAGYASITTHF
jgi:hypothetical protein